jgi:hypothetical protein
MSPRRRLAIVAGCVVGIALVGGLVFAANRPKPIGGGTVSATSSIAPDDGGLVFSDDFSSNRSGWYEGSSHLGITARYTVSGYVVDTPDGAFNDFAMAPYEKTYEQISVTTAGRLGSSAPPDAGFGVVCDRGSGSSELLYEFVVFEDGSWYIGRRAGPDFDKSPAVLHHGSGVALTGEPLRVEALCATLDDSTTRLALFARGQVLADFSDTVATIPAGGWAAGLLISGTSTRQTQVTFTSFELRDLTSGP